MTDILEGFGPRLRDIRRASGLTQVELSERTEISQKDISKYESGVIRNVRAYNLVRLADALGVSVDYLLGRSES